MRKRSARKVTRQHASNFGVAIFVGSLIGLLIIAALVIKLLLVFHSSTFDGKHQFVMAIRKPQVTQFLIFNPDNGSINNVIVNGNSPKNPESTFFVPVDSTATAMNTDAAINSLVTTLLLKRHQLLAKITIIDAIRLFLFTHSVDSNNESTQTFSSENFSNSISTGKSPFIDQTLYREGESIAIINATDVSGLGTKIASLLNLMGANVISVTSAENPSPSSTVGYTGTLSYTPSRVAHILHMPLNHLSGVQISDITITVGEDTAHFFAQ